MLPKELQNIIECLPSAHQNLFRSIISFYESKISFLEEKIAVLEQKVKELEDSKAKNSRNSSKPPSSDQPAKQLKTKSQRKRSGKKPGGKKGHKGETLKIISTPDQVIVHKVESCEQCHQDLSNRKSERIIKHQVYDIPLMKIQVVEHRLEEKTCDCGCVTKAAAPQEATHYVQYGPNIKSLIVYLQNYQLLPYSRTKELIADLLGHSLSTGSLYNISEQAYQNLSEFADQLKALLINEPVAGFDETGFKINKLLYWLHSCSTEQYAFYGIHPKRGKEAMDDLGILPNFEGIAVHDFWKSYLSYQCSHSLCNAHLLRDLTFIEGQYQQDWAVQMKALLIKMKTAKQRAIDKGKTTLCKQTLTKYRATYNQLLQKGLELNPFKKPKKKKRGRPKKPKPLLILERMRDYADDILRFFYDFDVPFDNNFSERDIRMMKVKQKISGCFRSLKGAQYFARIRSYIVTARKQKFSVLEALNSLFNGSSIAYSLIKT